MQPEQAWLCGVQVLGALKHHSDSVEALAFAPDLPYETRIQIYVHFGAVLAIICALF